MIYQFLPFEKLVEATRKLAEKLDSRFKKVDLIIAVPRSGTVPASILSLLFNCPIAGLTKSNKIEMLNSGERCRSSDKNDVIVVVEDVVSTGDQIKHVLDKIRAEWGTQPVASAAFSYLNFPCVYGEALRGPAFFEWHFFNSPMSEGRFPQWELNIYGSRTPIAYTTSAFKYSSRPRSRDVSLVIVDDNTSIPEDVTTRAIVTIKDLGVWIPNSGVTKFVVCGLSESAKIIHSRGYNVLDIPKKIVRTHESKPIFSAR